MSRSYDKIGFVGVGAMGKHMVLNLAKKSPYGTQIFICDINTVAVEELCSSNPDVISPCFSAREVASKSSLVFTMLPEGSHVSSVYLDAAKGIIAAELSNKILVECSTIDPTTHLDVRKEITSKHPSASMYDAPVSGGVLGAEKATLGIFLGSQESDPNFQLLHDTLGMLGKNIIPCGVPSSGLVAKLSNNYLSSIITLATAEAFNMGMRSGMDPRILQQVFAAGTAQNTIADKFNPVPGICPDAPSSHGYQGGFRVELMKKDITLATRMAASSGARLVLGYENLKAYIETSEDDRYRGLDSRVVYRYIGGREDWESKASGGVNANGQSQTNGSQNTHQYL